MKFLLGIVGIAIVTAIGGFVFGGWSCLPTCGKYDGEANCAPPIWGWSDCEWNEAQNDCGDFCTPGPDYNDPNWDYVEWTDDWIDKVSGEYSKIASWEQKTCFYVGYCERKPDPNNESGYLCEREPEVDWIPGYTDCIVLDLCTPCCQFWE